MIGKTRTFPASWTCAGCGTVIDGEVEIEQRHLDRSFNPAKYIATEKSALARAAAMEHARRGCQRPV